MAIIHLSVFMSRDLITLLDTPKEVVYISDSCGPLAQLVRAHP